MTFIIFRELPRVVAAVCECINSKASEPIYISRKSEQRTSERTHKKIIFICASILIRINNDNNKVKTNNNDNRTLNQTWDEEMKLDLLSLEKWFGLHFTQTEYAGERVCTAMCIFVMLKNK